MQAWLTAITRCHSVCSDRRAVSASSESHRMSSGRSTLRFRDLVTAEVAQHRLSFRPVIADMVERGRQYDERERLSPVDVNV